VAAMRGLGERLIHPEEKTKKLEEKK